MIWGRWEVERDWGKQVEAWGCETVYVCVWAHVWMQGRGKDRDM